MTGWRSVAVTAFILSSRVVAAADRATPLRIAPRWGTMWLSPDLTASLVTLEYKNPLPADSKAKGTVILELPDGIECLWAGNIKSEQIPGDNGRRGTVKDMEICPSYRGPGIMERIKSNAQVARSGVSSILSDEESYGRHNNFHYACVCPRCEKRWKEWLPLHRPLLEYRSAQDVVANYKQMPEHWRAWTWPCLTPPHKRRFPRSGKSSWHKRQCLVRSALPLTDRDRYGIEPSCPAPCPIVDGSGTWGTAPVRSP